MEVQSLKCSTSTRVKYWSSTSPDTKDEWIDDHELRAKLDTITSVTTDNSRSTETTKTRETILIATIGDPRGDMDNPYPLQIQKPTLQLLLDKCNFSPYLIEVWSTDQFHISSYTHCRDDGAPEALSILIRAPRNSRVINLALRIRLSDLSTIALLATAKEEVAFNILTRWARLPHLFRAHPLSILPLVLEQRVDSYTQWFNALRREVTTLESATGMTRPGWGVPLSAVQKTFLTDSHNLLRQQHAASVELCHCETVLSYLVKLGDFAQGSLQLLTRLCVENGHERPARAGHVALEERVGFVRGRLGFSKDKLNEMAKRIQAQIQVSFSLVAQKDSERNLMVALNSDRVAQLAARDSETMKSITVITLVFLPSSLVTSIWSANIFSLPGDSNWRVYIGTCVAITGMVLLIWLTYRYVQARERARGAEDLANLAESELNQERKYSSTFGSTTMTTNLR